jgi:beta-glucanase (GH16 family)
MMSLASRKRALHFLLMMVTLLSCKTEIITLPVAQINAVGMKPPEKIFPVNNILHFSGYKWLVTHSPNKRKAPGNNYWNDRNVWVDEKGFLHLILTKDPESNKWFCSQITSETAFGYGSFQFSIEGRIDQLDKNVVFGLFNYAGIDYHDEIDIEFSRWGNSKNPNLHYTVYPEENSDGKIWSAENEFLLSEPYSVHRFTRTATEVKFESDGKIHSQIYSGTTISKKPMPIYLNLWAFKNLAPSNHTEVEVIVQNFVFTPY